MDWLSWPLLSGFTLGGLTFCLGLLKNLRLALALAVISSAGTGLVAYVDAAQWAPSTFSSRLAGELQAVTRTN